MNAIYKVKLTPNPIIVRIENEQEEIIYSKYLKIQVAENLVATLNLGGIVNFDDLN